MQKIKNYLKKAIKILKLSDPILTAAFSQEDIFGGGGGGGTIMEHASFLSIYIVNHYPDIAPTYHVLVKIQLFTRASLKVIDRQLRY